MEGDELGGGGGGAEGWGECGGGVWEGELGGGAAWDDFGREGVGAGDEALVKGGDEGVAEEEGEWEEGVPRRQDGEEEGLDEPAKG